MMQSTTLHGGRDAKEAKSLRPLPLDNLPISRGFLQFPDDFQDFIGELPAFQQWSISLFGAPASGKSSFLLKLAEQLARYGTVLYNTNEESLDANTIQRRIDLTGVNTANIFIAANDDLEKLRGALKTGRYKFCIIDSINEFYDRETEKKILPGAVIRIRKDFPNISFGFASQVRSDGKRAGGMTSPHLADVDIRFQKDKNTGEATAETQKNRYGSPGRKMVVIPAYGVHKR